MTLEPSAKKQTLRGVFDRAATTYGGLRYFPLLGQWLVDTAQIPSGARVLDVACGRGAVLFPAAAQVGPQGGVVGIDLSDGMVQATNAAIQQLGLTQATARQMDAEHLDFPDATFDYVLCGFAIQFFPNLDQTLAEFQRVLKPGRPAVATTWGADNPSWGWFDDLRAAYQAVVKLGSQSFDNRQALLDRFSGAGFTGIQVFTTELDMVYPDEEAWWTMQWSLSGRAGLERLEPERLEAFKAEVFERMQAQRQADGFHDRLQACCTIAVRP